jgi:hypothetical protein
VDALRTASSTSPIRWARSIELLRSKKQRPLITARKGQAVRDVIALMRDNGVSQMPVLAADGSRLVGIVAEGDLLDHLVKGEGGLDTAIDALVESDYATVTPRRASPAAHDPQRREDRRRRGTGRHRRRDNKIDLIEYLAERRGE